jgi:hypothetical protein
MISSRQEEIASRMRELRQSGANVARQFTGDVERAKDWREYVRAMPLPSMLAAASIGFGIVLARPSNTKRPANLAALGTGAPDVMSAVPTRSRSTSSETENLPVNKARTHSVLRSLFQTAGSWAAAYAVSQATQFAKQVAAQQIQSLKTGFGIDVHRGKQQRENGAFEGTERERAYDSVSSRSPHGS